MGKTMVARYAGTCRKCEKSISVGETIYYGGTGYVFCETCPAEDAPKGAKKPKKSASSYRGRRGPYRVADTFGLPYSRNGRRCEDAPCCGCCS